MTKLPGDSDVCGDGRRLRIRDLYERLMVACDGATIIALRQRLREELGRPHACGTSQRDLDVCAGCLDGGHPCR